MKKKQSDHVHAILQASLRFCGAYISGKMCTSTRAEEIKYWQKRKRSRTHAQTHSHTATERQNELYADGWSVSPQPKSHFQQFAVRKTMKPPGRFKARRQRKAESLFFQATWTVSACTHQEIQYNEMFWNMKIMSKLLEILHKQKRSHSAIYSNPRVWRRVLQLLVFGLMPGNVALERTGVIMMQNTFFFFLKRTNSFILKGCLQMRLNALHWPRVTESSWIGEFLLPIMNVTR